MNNYEKTDKELENEFEENMTQAEKSIRKELRILKLADEIIRRIKQRIIRQ